MAAKDRDLFSAAPAPEFLHFFTELDDLARPRGIGEPLSALEFSSFGSFPRLTAGCLGDGSLGDAGALEASFGMDKACGGEGGGLGEAFFSDTRLSRLETRLQVGCRTGLPLILGSAEGVELALLVIGFVLDEHILVWCVQAKERVREEFEDDDCGVKGRRGGFRGVFIKKEKSGDKSERQVWEVGTWGG